MTTIEAGVGEAAYIAAREELEERHRAGANLAQLEDYAEHLPFPRDVRDALKLHALSLASQPRPRYQVLRGPLGHHLRPMRAARDPLHRLG